MGRVPGAVGVNVEILESVLADGPTEAQRAMLCAIPGAAFAVFDNDLRYVFVDGDFPRSLTPDPQREYEGRTAAEVFGTGSEQLLDAYRSTIAGRSVDIDFEYRGRVRWVHFAPVRDGHGVVVGGLSISVDVSEQRAEETSVHGRARAQAAIADPRPSRAGRDQRGATHDRGRRGGGRGPRRGRHEHRAARRGERAADAVRRQWLAGGRHPRHADPPDRRATGGCSPTSPPGRRTSTTCQTATRTARSCGRWAWRACSP